MHSHAERGSDHARGASMKLVLSAKLLQALAPWRNAPAWHIAFSGGLDSTVLLDLLAKLAHTETLPPLSAVHVHHGLQAAADTWPSHCQAVCESLGVPLRVMRVQVQPGASLERAARDARYQAFAEVTEAGQVMLTGQHRDDQAETLLFRLLRGAGVRGLAAMPVHRPLAGGHLVRPLLDVSRAELEAYAHEHQLIWVEDPSNADTRFSRNYLRHRVFAVLTERWPQAVISLARTAEHLSEAQALLDELAGDGADATAAAAARALRADDPGPAEALFAALGEGADPVAGRAALLGGRLADGRVDLERALALYRRAVALTPDNPDALLVAGRTARSLYHYREALDWLHTRVRLYAERGVEDPVGLALARRELAYTCVLGGQQRQAGPLYKEAMTALARHLGQDHAEMAVCWQQIGYMMIIYTTGLNNIPKDLSEAAAIDGAGTWQRF